nr:hypothetical protein [uncultured Mediterranean phage uvMED]BAR25981.1 hypothetical protein [uncultured Mediterranean phage uvMED]BAR25996.1 hypothetical protein [uncultured Mediterranean phage uvMED]BAR26039.1 hypothetical protein [uncultured Mediterranean phage uvMED]BAR26082.1 hypothetical protein [uncultured Mediterranean phage uvMED]
MAFGTVKVDTITTSTQSVTVDNLVDSSAATTFTALQTLNAGLSVDGPYKQVAEAVSALDIDLSTGNYFTKTISANSTFTFSNPPASGTVGSFTLELTHTSGTVTWPSSVKFPADTAPTLTTGKTHLFVFITDDGGTRYRGAALVDYVN